MTDRLALDANAVIDLVRDDRIDPPELLTAREVLLPLSVVGELFVGAFRSRNVERNLIAVEDYLRRWKVLIPNVETTRVYGRLSGAIGHQPATSARINDLWIAALCIQHDLPLLTNDRGFDVIQGLAVIHW